MILIFVFNSTNFWPKVSSLKTSKKGHEPSRAENPSARAMARASSARTHQKAVVLGSNRKLSQNVMTSRVCVYVWLKRGENFAEKEKE